MNIIAILKPTTCTWVFAHLVHWIGFLVAFSSNNAFVFYVLPFTEVPLVPLVDKNPYFVLSNLGILPPLQEKLAFNTVLVLAFWLQHSTMSRTWFKNFMVSTFSDQYLFFEKALFVFWSGVMLTIVLLGCQPITEVVVFEGFNSDLAYKIVLVVFLIGQFIFYHTMVDLIQSDVFGFDHFMHFKKEGTDFPVPFKMKYM